MGIETDLRRNGEFLTELRNCADLLMEKLQGDENEEVSKLIHSLAEVRDRHIFKSVGKLTRGLHNAIVNFNVDGDSTSGAPITEGSEIQDASDRLNYVINMTQKAADKTMDKVEAAAPIVLDLDQEAGVLLEQWRRLKQREMSADEFRQLYKRVDDFLVQTGVGAKQLNQNLQDIILEQGYQDLTGQVLTRVIELIRDVEKDLVSLVSIAGQVEEITGLTVVAAVAEKKADVEAEGPQIHADKRSDVVSGQDDVDDLLSSLGF